HADPSPVGGRAAPDVDGYVEHFALDHAYELGLRTAKLQMEAAQRALDRARVVVLYERRVDAVRAVPIRVIRLEEEAAAVAMNVGLDDEYPGQVGGNHTHVRRQAPNLIRAFAGGTARRRSIPSGAPGIGDRYA